MRTHPPQEWHQYKAPGFGLQRFLLVLMLLSLTAIVVGLFVLGEIWLGSTTPE